MTRARRRLLAAAASAIVALAGFNVGVSEARVPLELVNLRVAGGEDSWHADNDFRLDWDRPADPGRGEVVIATHYRVKDAAGNVVTPDTPLFGIGDEIEHIRVPASPGRYLAEVWLEGVGGQTGPRLSAALRFDDSAPAAARPSAPSGWLGASASPILRIEHAAGPLPLSGIRGYAVSVDGDPAGSPCAQPGRCTDDETDLHGGPGVDTISLGVQPEGVSFVHVAAVSGSGVRSATVGTATLRVDGTRPEIELRGVPAGWANGPVRLTATATDAASGMVAAGPTGPSTSIAVDAGTPKSEMGAAVGTWVSGEGVHRVVAYARDGTGNFSDPAGAPGRATASVAIDELSPAVAFARSQDPNEPERIEALVSDSLAGPDPAHGMIGVRPAATRQQFRALPTAVTAGKLVAHWDSDAFAPGNYEFRATGYDRAGNVTAALRRANGVRMVLPNPLKRPTAIEAGFGGRLLTWRRCVGRSPRRHCRHETIERFADRPKELSVPYGRGVPFAGRLISAAGSPLPGLPVQVIEILDPGAEPSRRTTTVQTDADGVFLAHLSPGPCRRVEAVFAGTRVLTSAASRRLRLEALTGVRMHTSTTAAKIGGAPILFSGALTSDGAAIPPGGRSVELQFRLRRSAWTEFRTVQTDARGRFRYPYSFSDDDSRGVRFEFRAFVPADDRWPYKPTGSRPVFVTGR